jgi:hypothetical protein
MIFLVLAWTLRFAPRGASLEPDRQAGIALVHQGSDGREYHSGSQAARPQADVSPSLQDALPSAEQLPIQLPGADSSSMPAAGPVTVAAAGQGAGAATVGGGRGGPEGSTQLSVFGVTGTGSKFVFVFDRSGSMEGYAGRPLAAAKSELIRSLEALDSIHQFQIIFYNENPSIFTPDGGTPRLIWGDEQGKRLAARFVRGITAGGGTHHMEALKLALRMRPDVIFFLTDADEPRLTTRDLAELRRQNRSTVIHTIEFGVGNQNASDNFLVRLAQQSAGQHAYVDVSRLAGP